MRKIVKVITDARARRDYRLWREYEEAQDRILDGKIAGRHRRTLTTRGYLKAGK